jgi:hypothetical protein
MVGFADICARSYWDDVGKVETSVMFNFAMIGKEKADIRNSAFQMPAYFLCSVFAAFQRNDS